MLLPISHLALSPKEMTAKTPNFTSGSESQRNEAKIPKDICA